MPKAIKELGCIDLHPAELNIVLPVRSEKTELEYQAGGELVKLIKNKLGRTPVLKESLEPENKFNIIIGELGEYKPDRETQVAGFQAYRIMIFQNRMYIKGNEPEGTYYGVKTLLQALSFSEDKIILPLLEVTDSADMEERGFWDYFYPAPLRQSSELFSFKQSDDWFRLIDKLSNFKINLMQLLVSGEHSHGQEGLIYHSKRFPELVEPGLPDNKNDLIRDVIGYGKKCGMKITLGIVHPEQMAIIGKRYPETRAKNPKGCQPSLRDKQFCFSHPLTQKIISGILEEINEMFSPTRVFIWMPEHLGHCSCGSCRDRWGGIAAFMKICDKANRKIRKNHPQFRLRILVSFMRYSDQVMKLIPPDVDLVYYECDRHGPYGFSNKKKLPERLVQLTKNGNRILGCLNYRGQVISFIPQPYFSNIKEWVQLMIRRGISGVDGSIASCPEVNLMNLLCMEEYAWNSNGTDISRFIRACLYQLGKDQLEDRTQVWLTLSEAWNLYHTLHPRLCDEHALDRISELQPIDYLDCVYIVDSLEDRILPDLRKILLNLEKAEVKTKKIDDGQLISMVQACRALLSFQFHVFAAFHVYGRQRWPDPEKGPWNDWIDELLDHVAAARTKLRKAKKITNNIISVLRGKPDAAMNNQKLLDKLDKMLKPDFREKLLKLDWEDIDSFA